MKQIPITESHRGRRVKAKGERRTSASNRQSASTVPGSDALDRVARDFQAALSDLVRVYQFRDRNCICCHDVSVSQCYALEALVRRGPLSLKDLADELYLDKSTASRVMDALERKGYSRRSPDPTDGRGVRLEATPRGKDLYTRIDEELVEQKKKLLAEFEPEVREAATRLIGRISRAASGRVSGDDGEACCP